jgi:hypothetical protein
MEAWFAQPIDKKQTLGRNTWANTALVLALRAKRASQVYGKKDFNALYRLILSAGIAYDKAWPREQETLGASTLVVNLFGSLGQDKVARILKPDHPVIDVSSSTTVETPTDNVGSDTKVEPTK